jgi:hypothetical protein
MKLNPVTFNYNDTYYSQTGYSRPGGATPTYTGFIAQELQQIFPEMVSTAANGYLDTNLSNLQIYLVKGIQEQQKQIASLSASLANLSPTVPVIKDELWIYATASGKLMTIIPVQVPELTVTGKLHVGLVTIDDIDASISSLTGVINISGDLAVSGSIKVLGTSAGKATLSAGATTLEISNANVATTSAIFVTPEEPALVGAKVSESGKFVISIPASMSSELKVNWWVVN